MNITQESTLQVLNSSPDDKTGVRLEKASSLDLGTEVVSAALSTDGKWLALASYPAQISLVNLGTKETHDILPRTAGAAGDRFGFFT